MTPLPRMRPVVRYHGGKARIADWIVGFMPPHDAYTEVYGGGASVLLRKPRVKAEVYNDLDETMVHLFRVLRGPRAAELVRQLELTPYSRDEFVTAYEPCEDDVERARRTIVRSFMSYGSDGTNGHYTTGFRLQVSSTNKLPAGEWSTYPRALRRIIERLRPTDESRGVVIENCDAMLLLPRMDSPGTLHYVDPPYLPETRSQGNRRRGAGYHVYAHELDTEQHRALLKLLCEIDGMVILSGYPSPLYDDSLTGWRRESKKTYADRGGLRTECLWLNPAAQRALAHGPLFA